MSEASSATAASDPNGAVKPRVFSGIQPTADSFHLGNYLGALRQWVAMQDTHDAFYCVVDLHAITVEHDPAVLRRRTKVAIAQLLAMGVDPDRATLFVQSQVPEHAELAWVLGCLTGFGEAGRMTQFKDKSSKQGTSGTSVGLFTYPILQAADILLYTPDPGVEGRAIRVPVGEDQRQHLELTRTLAQRFNHRFGETFVPPEAHIPAGAAKITDLQEPDAKMSKSASSPQGIIDVLEEPGPMRKKIMRAVTDTGSEVVYDEEKKAGITNLLRIFSALDGTSIPDLEKRYEGSGYGQFKKDLAQVVVDTFTPIRERTLKLLDDEEQLDRVLAQGAERASTVAARTMDIVRERVGFVGRGR
ncbi:tryptophanyl-tRNA synthetase [Actinomadura pelletieri DSM 43383]|uniref:Tryptophan--tRNA ligase n=1 Tax=Actinomadura pelletieri DSM 43383 TaxID=1120940 RepID=A0A495QRX6_9ACTN|nr:tryptophan--tRNA ligase [Actinomadura pelletieri]RKS76244.1 tryptophanyl-tRNA synthetase [Actinomadura pelletieri DSM 43383]